MCWAIWHIFIMLLFFCLAMSLDRCLVIIFPPTLNPPSLSFTSFSFIPHSFVSDGLVFNSLSCSNDRQRKLIACVRRLSLLRFSRDFCVCSNFTFTALVCVCLYLKFCLHFKVLKVQYNVECCIQRGRGRRNARNIVTDTHGQDIHF